MEGISHCHSDDITYVTRTLVQHIGRDTYPSAGLRNFENWRHGDTVLFLDTGKGTCRSLLINNYGSLGLICLLLTEAEWCRIWPSHQLSSFGSTLFSTELFINNLLIPAQKLGWSIKRAFDYWRLIIRGRFMCQLLILTLISSLYYAPLLIIISTIL